MKNKKGFTLVELLAVIAILSILVVLVVPNVLRMYRKAKKDTFTTQARTVFNTIMKQNFLDQSNQPKLLKTGDVDITGGSELEYSISTDQLGQIVCFQIADNDYMWIYRSKGQPLTNEEDIALEEEIIERDSDIILDCSGAQLFDVTIPATLGSNGSWWPTGVDKSSIERIIFTYSYDSRENEQTFYSDAEEVGGLATFVKDNVAYIVINRNKRKTHSVNMPADSSNTFAGFPNLKNIQGLKLLDFSKVTKMDNFFGRYNNGEIIDGLSYINGYDSFNTNKLTSAKYAFAGVKMSSIDLSRWNTSTLEDVTGMFYKTNASVINLSGWNVSKITNYTDMFANSSKLENINLSGWNTKPDATYTGMFNNCGNLISISADSGFQVNNNNIVMFKDDTKLTGPYNAYSTDKSLYARVDTQDTPGYFTSQVSEGVMSARLYDTGTVSGSYTDLTKEGSIPSDWNYYSGARLLEVKLYSMRQGYQKTLDISVPAGMYIVKNSWTKSGGGIASVNFTKLSNQEMGSYSNAQTGTLKYTFSDSATSASVQMLVMFDPAVWDKHKKGISTGNSSMTLTAPIVVDYNNGNITRKISKIQSDVSIGRNSNGMGYSFYVYNNNNNIYIDQSTVLLASNSFLSSDQSSNPYFYRKVKYRTYATFQKEDGSTGRATIETGVVPSYLSNNVATDSNETYYSGEWNNVYNSSGIAFPRPKYKVKQSDHPKIGTNLSVYIEVEVTTLSGQVKTLNTTRTFVIKPTSFDKNDIVLGSGNKTSPTAAYYGSSGYSGMLGTFTMYNKGYASVSDIKVVYEYDTGTPANTPPAMKVMAARPFLDVSQEVNAKITLVNDSGNEVVAQNFKLKSASNASETSTTSNTNGAYVAASTVAGTLNLTGDYYLKKIEYTIPKVRGCLGDTCTINYLYHSQGSGSQSSGGNFMGVISKQATSKCTITYDGNEKTVISTSNITNSPSFSGYISKINTPLGTEFTAGDDIELAINVASVSYPYTNTQAFSKPEVYLILPFGINIDNVVIGNSPTDTIPETQPLVTKIKTMTIGGVLNNVYKITARDNIWFGYLNIQSTGANSGQYASKWFRVKLTTDLSMEYTSINLRDSVYFKDASGDIAISGSYAQYSIVDQFDVDNDGSTTDKFGTTNNANQIINIYEASEDE